MIIRSNRRYAAMFLILILGLFFVPLDPQLRFDPVWGPLGNRVHTFLFIFITLVLYSTGPVRGRLKTAVATAFGVGCAVEVLQAPFGRSPSVDDLGFNAMGIAIASGLIIWSRGRRSPAIIILVGITGLLAFQLRDWPADIRAAHRMRAEFPLLYDFEPDGRPGFGESDGAGSGSRYWKPFFESTTSLQRLPQDGEDVPRGNREAATGHVLQFTAPGNESWPGVATQWFPLDWSEYDSLLVAVRIETMDPQAVDLGIRLEDAAFLDDGAYYSQSFRANREWRTVSFPIHGLTTREPVRPLDPSRMITMKFYVKRPRDEVTVQIDNIRLR